MWWKSQGEDALSSEPKKMKLTPLAKAMNKPTKAMAVATEFDTGNRKNPARALPPCMLADGAERRGWKGGGEEREFFTMPRQQHNIITSDLPG